MATRNYEITIKLNKKEMPKFKEKLSKKIMEEAGPDIHAAIRDIFLYHKMRPGQGKSIAEFLISHAGIFPAAIIDNMKRKHLKYGQGTASGVSVQSIPNGTELVIKAELSESAATEFANYNPEAIMRIVSGLDPSTAKTIFQRAVDKAGLD